MKSHGHTASLPRSSAYGQTSAVCGACRSRLKVRIETDGFGKIVDVVAPCPRCTPRQGRFIVKPGSSVKGTSPVKGTPRRRERMRIKTAARRAGVPAPPIDGTCRGCGEPFLQPSKTGRPFSYCDGCRG